MKGIMKEGVELYECRGVYNGCTASLTPSLLVPFPDCGLSPSLSLSLSLPPVPSHPLPLPTATTYLEKNTSPCLAAKNSGIITNQGGFFYLKRTMGRLPPPLSGLSFCFWEKKSKGVNFTVPFFFFFGFWFLVQFFCFIFPE